MVFFKALGITVYVASLIRSDFSQRRASAIWLIRLNMHVLQAVNWGGALHNLATLAMSKLIFAFALHLSLSFFSGSNN